MAHAACITTHQDLENLTADEMGLALSAQLIYKKQTAEVAELADALGSGPSGLRAVEVQVLSSAP